jgi:hypothetical protein
MLMTEKPFRPSEPDPRQMAGLPPLPEGFSPKIPESPDVVWARRERQAAAAHATWMRERRARDDLFVPVGTVTKEDLSDMVLTAPIPENMSREDYFALSAGQRERLALVAHYGEGVNLQAVDAGPNAPESYIIEVPGDPTAQTPDHVPENFS